MKKSELKLYKSGRKNPNGYSFSRYIFFKKRSTPIILSIIVAISLVMSILSYHGILTWNQLFSKTGIIEGVKLQDSNFSVYFLDVGQSDCTIITCDDKVMLIDTGTLFQVHNIRESLFSLDIDKIDCLVVSHQHDDHMSGASKLIEECKVEKVIMPELSMDNYVDSLTYQDLMSKIKYYNVDYSAISSGYSFNVGSAFVQVLAPIQQDENLNNMSLVLKVTYGNTSFLFQGDAEADVEKQIMLSGIDLSADVIKIGHHGSNTSTTENYLQEVKPKYAVISAGIDNTYGHPSTPVINRLIKNNIEPLITSYHGDIVINSDGDNIQIIKQKDKDFISLN